MKGMAIETIGYVLIALFGVFVLMVFVSGSLSDLIRNSFCYFYQKIFLKSTEMCRSIVTKPEQVAIRPEDSEDLARQIAAYSILCWEKAAKSLKTKDTNCYSLMIEGGPFSSPPVDEQEVTNILLSEGGCERLENSDISPDCGTRNQLAWEIDGGSITDQKLVLIKYSDSEKAIVVKG